MPYPEGSGKDDVCTLHPAYYICVLFILTASDFLRCNWIHLLAIKICIDIFTKWKMTYPLLRPEVPGFSPWYSITAAKTHITWPVLFNSPISPMSGSYTACAKLIFLIVRKVQRVHKVRLRIFNAKSQPSLMGWQFHSSHKSTGIKICDTAGCKEGKWTHHCSQCSGFAKWWLHRDLIQGPI